MNKALLESKMVAKSITTEMLSKKLGIAPETFYRKKIGESDFYRKEIQIIRKELSLSSADVDEIFFND